MLGSNTDQKILTTGALLTLIIMGGIIWNLKSPQSKHLIISTTTSLYETGVLGDIKEMFEAKYPGITISFISKGTGLAIETAVNGDVDMILVHSPSQEQGFLESGYGVNRKIFAYNYFLLVGPPGDPAGIKDMDLKTGLNKLHVMGRSGNASWVSRGDNSGTHSKEKNLWQSTGLDLDVIKAETWGDSSRPWYIEAGGGMTATLQVANEKEAYTLTDAATYLKNYLEGNIQLEVIIGQGEETLNVYSAILCNPEKTPRGMYDEALIFMQYLLGEEMQEFLLDYGVEEYGVALFNPWVPELEAPSTLIVQWVREYSYIDGSECPEEYRYHPGDLYN